MSTGSRVVPLWWCGRERRCQGPPTSARGTSVPAGGAHNTITTLKQQLRIKTLTM